MPPKSSYRTTQMSGSQRVIPSSLSRINPVSLSPSLRGANKLPKYNKGGMVKKTGPAIVHKGERVLNTKQTRKYDSDKSKKTKIGNAAGKLMGGLYSK